MTFTFSIILLYPTLLHWKLTRTLVTELWNFSYWRLFASNRLFEEKNIFLKTLTFTVLTGKQSRVLPSFMCRIFVFSHYVIISPTYRTTSPIFQIKVINNACAHVDSRVTIYIARKNVVQRCVLCLNCVW